MFALGLGALDLPELGDGVGHLDVQLLGTLHDQLPGARGYVVRNLRTVLAVVHQQHLQFLGVVHDELVEAIGQQVAGGLVGT